MMPLGRLLLVAALLCHGVIAEQLGAQSRETVAVRSSAPRKLHGRFLHISDIHPDEFYKVHSSTDEDGGCHRGKGPAGPYGAETTDCDSPFSLVNATFDWIDANLKDNIDFVVWTGDSARHDRDEGLPRDADQVLGTNSWIADKFVDMFAHKNGGKKSLTVPVIPTFGNNDILPHNILLPGPNKWFQHYLHIWRHFIPEEQRHSFSYGGWFFVEAIPNQLAVFSLNTLYFFDRNAGVDGCADASEPGFKQMEWLKVQLLFLRERGMKAILTGHVPPARTESKMLWDETCFQKYTTWMRQFRDVVVVGLYGHMNIDHFLIHGEDEVELGSDSGVRVAMEDELSVQSASDYLTELRSIWATLTPPPASPEKQVGKKGKGKKGKHSKDPWSEQYYLSLVSPSVVPNYFPTLRVFEYNITGLENTVLWQDAQETQTDQDNGDGTQKHLELRDLPDADSIGIEDFDMIETDDDNNDDDTLEPTKKDKNKNKKKKKKHPKKPKNPPSKDLPPPPSKSAPPGPAYSPQPLTLTGYTQYFANLTHINNLTLIPDTPAASVWPFSSPSRHLADDFEDDDDDTWTTWLLHPFGRWRKGKHGNKKPAHPKPPPPRKFEYQVEYSTFEDRIYRLGDLTVNSYVELAWRMGGKVGKTAGVDESRYEYRDGDDEYDVEGGGDEDEDDDWEDEEVDADKKKKKGRKGKGKKDRKKQKKKQDKTWLHFLRHAFVNTLEEDELEDFL